MKQRILNYMIKFGGISTYDAFRDLGCTRLSEYIRQLRYEYDIQDEWIYTTNRYNEKVKFKRYWIGDKIGFN